MQLITKSIFEKIQTPDKYSHKGQNGKVLIIGGSSLFHGASLWALKTASRIVDMTFYLSVEKNQQYADWLNRQLYDFINIDFKDVDEYVREADAVLIGPGMVRNNISGSIINKLTAENFENTREVVKHLFFKYPEKKWVIDAGALQTMSADWLKKLKNAVITPHAKEFNRLFDTDLQMPGKKLSQPAFEKIVDTVRQKSKEYGCVILLKGEIDIICSKDKCMLNKTGNEGMTKGGTGDVLAGLIAGFSAKNDLFASASAGIYANGLAGDELFEKFGDFFNASDLCQQIPITLHNLLSKVKLKP